MYNKQESKDLELHEVLLKVPKVQPKSHTKEFGFLKEYKKILNRPFDPNFKKFWTHSADRVLTKTQMENRVHQKNPLLEKKFAIKQVILEPIKKPESPAPIPATEQKCRKIHRKRHKQTCKYFEKKPLITPADVAAQLIKNEAKLKNKIIESEIQPQPLDKKAEDGAQHDENETLDTETDGYISGIEASIDGSQYIDKLLPSADSKPLVNPAVQNLIANSLPSTPILRKKLPFAHRLQLERTLSLDKPSSIAPSGGSFPSLQASRTKSVLAPTSSNAQLTPDIRSTSSLAGSTLAIGTSSVGSLHIKPYLFSNSMEYVADTMILPTFIKPSTFRWKTAIYTIMQRNRLAEIPNMSQTEVKLNLSNFETPTLVGEKKVVLAAITGIQKLYSSKSAKEKDFKVDMKYLPFDETLCYFPHLKKQKLNVRLAIAGCCWLEVVPRGKRIIREGDPVRTVYFLLCGLCVEHMKIEPAADSQAPPKEDLIRVMKPSDTIGDIAGNVVSTRTFSLTTLTRSLFICVDKHDWLSAMRNGNFEIQKIEILSTLVLFMGLPPQTLEHLSSYASESNFGSEEQIMEPHTEPEDYYFISRGKVKLVINLPFIKTVTDESKDLVAPEKFQVIPYFGQSINPERDEFVYIAHTVGELNPGDFFPPISQDHRGLYKLYSVRTLENTDFLIFNKTSLQCFPSIVAQRLRSQEEVQFLNDYQVRELQEYYLSTKGWRSDTDTSLSKMLINEVDNERTLQVMERFKSSNTKY
ncbi:hypothetical protein HDV01_001454 [Terramyces sp. JEL0728]|nr:hypothetical protein HDV01_001454 [Terramyces sp. JEL0728]